MIRHQTPFPTFSHQSIPSYTPHGDTQFHRSAVMTTYKLPKVEFPKFDGTNARGWVVKANKFSMLNLGMDTSTKIVFASLYLEGPADHWFQTIQVEHPELTWETFVELLLQRFSSGNQENLVGKFNKLVQKGTVAEYVAEFEELRGYLLTHHNVHTPDFYLSSFLSGLRADIQQALYVYKPRTLTEAMEKAREHETLMDILEKRSKAPSKTPYVKPHTDWQPSKATVSSVPPSVFSQPIASKLPEIKKISPQEMANRREKGLCYNCDEVYSRGHKCQRP